MTHGEQPKLWGVYALPLMLGGFLFARYTLWNGPAISTALFACLLVLTCLLYCRAMGTKMARESYGIPAGRGKPQRFTVKAVAFSRKPEQTI